MARSRSGGNFAGNMGELCERLREDGRQSRKQAHIEQKQLLLSGCGARLYANLLVHRSPARHEGRLMAQSRSGDNSAGALTNSVNTCTAPSANRRSKPTSRKRCRSCHEAPPGFSLT